MDRNFASRKGSIFLPSKTCEEIYIIRLTSYEKCDMMYLAEVNRNEKKRLQPRPYGRRCQSS